MHTSVPRLAATRKDAEDIVCREIANHLYTGKEVRSIARAGGDKMLRDFQWLTETAKNEGWFKGRYCPLVFDWDIKEINLETVPDQWERKFWKLLWTPSHGDKRRK